MSRVCASQSRPNLREFQNATEGFTPGSRSAVPRYRRYSRYGSSFLGVCYELQRASPVPAWAYLFTYSL